MDLQTRKLNAIGYLINLQDEKILDKIEDTIFETKNPVPINSKPFTKKQLIDRARRANQDYSLGKIKTQDQLASESDSW